MEVEVSEPEVFGSDVQPPFVRQVVDFWLNPELERRRSTNTLPAGFSLWAAQVIFQPDGSKVVRLNDEIRAVVTLKAARTLSVGDPVRLSELDEVKEIRLTDQDPNAGHVTLIRGTGGWRVAFDFRYNGGHARQHLARAREFLDASADAISRENVGAALDTLFSAVELMAKTVLMLHDEAVRTTRRHEDVHLRFDRWKDLGNVDARYGLLLNNLKSLRGPARYLHSDHGTTTDDARGLLETAEEMFADASRSIPVTWPPDQPVAPLMPLGKLPQEVGG